MPVLTKINTNSIADDAVTSAKIPTDALGATDIAAGAVGSSEIAADAVGTDELANDVVINTSGAITGTGLTTVSKIVETGGVLKENLLTNSGFDVWSNSTWQTYGANLRDTTLYAMNGMNQSHVSGPEITNATYTGNSSAANPEFRGNMLDHVIGDQYRYQTTIASSGSPSALRMYVQGNMFASASVATLTHYYTATQVNPLTQYLVLKANTLPATTTTNTSIYQMIPGCVAANSLAADTHGKDSTLSTYRQPPHATYTKGGSYYSLKTVNGASDRAYYLNLARETSPIWLDSIAGRTLTFGVWAYTTTANHARLGNYDGTSYEYSAYAPASTWTWLEMTRTFPASPTYGRFFLHTNVNSATAYFSQPMLVFGSSIGEGNYTRPKGEIVDCETNIRFVSGIAQAASNDTILNLEELSSGKIPKGIKAIYCEAQLMNTSVTSDQGIQWGPDSGNTGMLRCHPPINSFWHQAAGWINCDGNGDIYQLVKETDATLSALYLDAHKIELY